MGNGNQGTTGPAAIVLYQPKKDASTPRIPVPAHTLTFGNLFPDQTVEFSFGDLTPDGRQSLAACFQI